MTDAAGSRPWGRLTGRLIVGFLVALAVGTALGVLVDFISPNPTHGRQIDQADRLRLSQRDFDRRLEVGLGQRAYIENTKK